jgi:hypothetical protein
LICRQDAVGTSFVCVSYATRVVLEPTAREWHLNLSAITHPLAPNAALRGIFAH